MISSAETKHISVSCFELTLRFPPNRETGSAPLTSYSGSDGEANFGRASKMNEIFIAEFPESKLNGSLACRQWSQPRNAVFKGPPRHRKQQQIVCVIEIREFKPKRHICKFNETGQHAFWLDVIGHAVVTRSRKRFVAFSGSWISRIFASFCVSLYRNSLHLRVLNTQPPRYRNL